MPSLEFRRAATERIAIGAQRGDVLIAEWSFQEAWGKGLIVMTDTPYYAHFALRLSGCQIRTQAELTAFLKAALVWGGSPIIPSWTEESPPDHSEAGEPPEDEMAGMPGPLFTVYLPTGSAPITHLWALARTPSPYPFIADFQIFGLFESPEWFLDFGVGKSRTEELYGVPAWVPERFPPLRDLVKSWSFARIRGEVGHEVKPFEGVRDFTGERDEILIAELARRGLSQDQVVDLLRDVKPTEDGYDSRLRVVSRGFLDSGKGPFVKLFFEPALETYEQLEPVAKKSVGSLFMGASGSCSTAVEARALDLMRKGVLYGPLVYLSRCSSSPDSLAAIEATSAPSGTLESEFEREKELAAGQIRDRIKSTSKPVRRSHP